MYLNFLLQNYDDLFLRCFCLALACLELLLYGLLSLMLLLLLCLKGAEVVANARQVVLVRVLVLLLMLLLTLLLLGVLLLWLLVDVVLGLLLGLLLLGLLLDLLVAVAHRLLHSDFENWLVLHLLYAHSMRVDVLQQLL